MYRGCTRENDVKMQKGQKKKKKQLIPKNPTDPRNQSDQDELIASIQE
jgi:hypothetical protein